MRTLGGAVFALSVFLTAGAAFSGERFEIPALGFSMIAPDGWIDNTDRVVSVGLSKPPIIPAEKRQFVKHYSGETVLQLGGPRSDQNPHGGSISVVVIDEELGDPKAQLEMLVPDIRKNTHNFRSIIAPSYYEISGEIGAMMKYFEIYLIANGDMIAPRHSWSYIAPHMDHTFLIFMGIDDIAPVELQDAMEAAIQTIEIR